MQCGEGYFMTIRGDTLKNFPLVVVGIPDDLFAKVDYTQENAVYDTWYNSHFLFAFMFYSAV